MLKTLISLLRLTSGRQSISLLFFFAAQLFYKLSPVRLFEGIAIRFRNVILFLKTDFPSGIRFADEIIAKNVYGEFSTDGESLLLDVGANVGLLTLSRCALNPRLRAHCIEPHPQTFALLQTNVAINGLSDRVQVHHGALSDHEGHVAILAAADANMARTLDFAGENSVSVPCWTLDGFCRDQQIRPTMLKIDVEGHELAVLRGGTKTLQNVRQLVVECHSEELMKAAER